MGGLAKAPGCRPPVCRTSPQMQTPLEANPLPSMGRMRDTCENITLPQTSFAGGNYHCRKEGIFVSLVFCKKYMNNSVFTNIVVVKDKCPQTGVSHSVHNRPHGSSSLLRGGRYASYWNVFFLYSLFIIYSAKV